jgi:hypothetical protein
VVAAHDAAVAAGEAPLWCVPAWVQHVTFDPM